MTTESLPFATDYHEARALFLQALDAFEARAAVRFERQRHVIDAAADLSIDWAEYRPPSPERVYLAVSGIHGIEGFAGNAIQRALLASVLGRADLSRTGLVLVHALNPWGMHALRRVNRCNVDLNRNFSTHDDALYQTDSRGYLLLARTLGPETSYDGGALTHGLFFAELAAAVARHGYATLRQATLAGQYAMPRGLFYGGSEPQPETRCFEQIYAGLCARYPQVLLTDLHTGYGRRGQASALFGRADTPAFREFVDLGVRDRRGQDQRYTAHGDLVGYCQRTAKRLAPGGVFDGVVVELGTGGLGPLSQLSDLHAVVRENQVHHHGARDAAVAERVRARFRALFDPRDADWQRTAVHAAVSCITGLLERCDYVARRG